MNNNVVIDKSFTALGSVDWLSREWFNNSERQQAGDENILAASEKDNAILVTESVCKSRFW